MMSIKMKSFMISLALCVILIQLAQLNQEADCAPNGQINTNGNNRQASNTNTSTNNTNKSRQPLNFLRGLFRRQTSSSASSGTSTQAGRQQASAESNVEGEGDDAMSQTELDAKKFMDSLPNVNNNNDNDRPNTLRERVSGSFGVLREGVSNQFRTLRENWSETMEDLRDQWSNSSD